MEQQQAMKYALMRHGVLKAVRCASAPATLVTTASADRGVVNAILAKLDGAGLSVLSATPGARVDAVPPKSVLHLVHESVRTSQEAADVRGASLASGAKAMLLARPGSPDLCLMVMSASERIHWKKVRALLGKTRMVDADDVPRKIGCMPGSVPPFGSIFKTATITYCDSSLQRQGSIMNFNCGLRTESMTMNVDDYIELERPRMADFVHDS